MLIEQLGHFDVGGPVDEEAGGGGDDGDEEEEEEYEGEKVMPLTPCRLEDPLHRITT